MQTAAQTTAQVGILLVNLGTPAAPEPAAVKAYLAEFLSDQRVIQLWRPLRWMILHGLILPTRPAKTARTYRAIWSPDGSPLLVIARAQLHALQAQWTQPHDPAALALGMRYGEPSIAAGLGELRAGGAQQFVILPLYPQFSYTTTAAVEDAVVAVIRDWGAPYDYHLIPDYHDHPDYIAALAQSVRDYRRAHAIPDTAGRLLISFHGLPEKYVRAGDPYSQQCQTTARQLAAQLGLTDDQWQIAFQSRFGLARWLQPATAQVLQQWAVAGVHPVLVICPGFSADCLETLYEIAQEYREVFDRAGGQLFHYIPCLNTAPAHINMLQQLLRETLHTRPDNPPLN